MSGILRKILPAAPLSPRSVSVEEFNPDYSFAIEYKGPPITYNIPKVVPVDIDQVPTAAIVASGSLLNDLSVPVVQPIVKSNPGRKKLVVESYLGSETNKSSCERKEDSLTHSLHKQSSVVKGLELPSSTDDDPAMPKSSDGDGSFGSLGFSGSCRDSNGSWGSSGILELPDDVKENVEFQDCLDQPNDISREANMSSRSLSLHEDEISEIEAPGHVRKASVVTFRDYDSSETFYEESVYAEADVNPVRPVAERKGKKGSCYRCCEGTRFTEKEICLVCGAKYCGYCLLRAMGAMPEGRKCITCIGFTIDESKRDNLGKCSRLLKRLLTKSQIKEIMTSERVSKVNQLPPEFVYVNRKPLSQEELIVLQSCHNPPKKLKPGYYWYDKVSGLWGKEGQKPLQIISAHLNVGNPITRDVSNGNTNILINNREITKAELRMLWWAGVECEGHPHFWVNADGSYQEEGQNNVLGNLWGKTGIKVVSTILSLPIPPNITKSSEEVNTPVNGVVPDHPGQKWLNKFLLVGYSKSGAGTIFKQAKVLYNVKFSEDELQNLKFLIQSNLYRYLCLLLEWRECFEEESLIKIRKGQSSDEAGPSGHDDDKSIYSLGPRLKAFSDWLVQIKMSGNLDAIFPASAREYAPLVEELWKDGAIQATYNRRSEYEMLPRAANYFLDRVVEISREDYEPSSTDIVYAEGITSSNGLASMEFSYLKAPRDERLDPPYQHDQSTSYQLIRVHAKSLGENCKWLEMFEDVAIVIFCVSMTDYSQLCEDGRNKMLASKSLFENIVTDPKFANKNFLLILNKFDLLEEKIEEVPLTVCEWFGDFNPVITHNPNCTSAVYTNPSLAQRAFNYIAVKFKRLFNSLVGLDRKLYVAPTTGLEPDTVDEALRYARDILRWEVEKPNFSQTEMSSYSNDVSSTP